AVGCILVRVSQRARAVFQPPGRAPPPFLQCRRMNFLFPLYLLGAAAVIIPILLHLRRRPPQELVPFSAMMFLDPAPVPPVKRRKLEDLLLLAPRCLALVGLALMFARPLFPKKDPPISAGRACVIL